jgi:hypothetical protein
MELDDRSGGSSKVSRKREVLKFKIMNSSNLFNYFRRVVLRMVEFLETVSLSPGWIQNRFQNGPFQNR